MASLAFIMAVMVRGKVSVVIVCLVAGAALTMAVLGLAGYNFMSRQLKLDQAAKYVKAGDYVRARKIYQELAAKGDRAAMNILGAYYQQGRGGLPKNERIAVYWYRKAADAGDSYGMENLGNNYAQGATTKERRGGVSLVSKSREAWKSLRHDCGPSTPKAEPGSRWIKDKPLASW